MAFSAAFVAFHACSSDEANDPSTAKSQLLVQKSKEFAKRYGVDLVLNESTLDETSKTLTVEQMEKDYQEWANMKIQMKLSDVNHAKSTNKLRLTKRRASFEATNIHGEYKDVASNDASFYVEVEYNLGNGSKGLVNVEVSRNNSRGRTTLVPTGFTIRNANDYSFTAVGTVYMSGGKYNGTVRVWIDRSIDGRLEVDILPL